MNALSRLILRRREQLDLTWAEIAQRGGFSGHTTVYNLAHKSFKAPPRQETLHQLAVALDLPLDVVKAAAAEAAGLRVEEINVPLSASEDARVVVASLSELDERDRAIIRGMVESFAKEESRRHDKGTT